MLVKNLTRAEILTRLFTKFTYFSTQKDTHWRETLENQSLGQSFQIEIFSFTLSEDTHW